jgi:hypothetical protein
MGFNNADIGWNAQTKLPTLQGRDLSGINYTPGSDQHMYANPNDVTKALTASGVQTPMSMSPYQNTQIQDTLRNIQQRLDEGFQYDPGQDEDLKQAQGQVMKTVREDMGSRGMLYSDATKSLMTQEAAKLVPQYRQIAYGQYQDEISRMYDFADFVTKLDQENYNRVRDYWARDWEQKMFTYQQEQDKIVNERNLIKDAWDRVNQVGYVDNQTSVLVGLPVGTPSQAAREALQQRKWELEDYEKELRDQRETDAINFSQQKEIMRLQEEATIRAEERKRKAEESENKTKFSNDAYLKKAESEMNAKVPTGQVDIDGKPITRPKYTRKQFEEWLANLPVDDQTYDEMVMYLNLDNQEFAPDVEDTMKQYKPRR